MHGNVASAIDTRDNSIVAIKISRGTHDERQGAETEVATWILLVANDPTTGLLLEDPL